MKNGLLASLAVAGLIVGTSDAVAATVTLTTTQDALVANGGGSPVVFDSSSDMTVSSVSGTFAKAVFEFDLSGILDTDTINSAKFNFTIGSAVTSVLPTVPYFIEAFLGDGSVTTGDFDAAATTVFSGALIPFSLGGTTSAGTVISVALTDLTTVQTALTADLLTLRMTVPGNFQQIRVASLGNSSGYAAASLTLDTSAVSPPAVPLPAGMPLLLAGFGVLAIFRRRRA